MEGLRIKPLRPQRNAVTYLTVHCIGVLLFVEMVEEGFRLPRCLTNSLALEPEPFQNLYIDLLKVLMFFENFFK